MCVPVGCRVMNAVPRWLLCHCWELAGQLARAQLAHIQHALCRDKIDTAHPLLGCTYPATSGCGSELGTVAPGPARRPFAAQSECCHPPTARLHWFYVHFLVVTQSLVPKMQDRSVPPSLRTSECCRPPTARLHRFDMRLLAVAQRLVPMMQESFLAVKEEITQLAINQVRWGHRGRGLGGRG